MDVTVSPTVIGTASGYVQKNGAGAVGTVVIGSPSGVPPRHIDVATAELALFSATWVDLKQTRIAIFQRELDPGCPLCTARHAGVDKRELRGIAHARHCIGGTFEAGERLVHGRLERALRRHPLWPWLSQLPGLGGGHVARLIGIIGDPRRFPGQRCTVGHTLPPIYEAGSPCPLTERRAGIDRPNGEGVDDAGAVDAPTETDDGSGCPGVMFLPRETTGTRSLWHYLGLHVGPDGRAPRKRKGQQATWNPAGRTCVLQPGGIVEQIVRHGVRVDKETGERVALHPYGAKYLEARIRLQRERAAVTFAESDFRGGRSAKQARVDGLSEIEATSGPRLLRPFEIDDIARLVAGKAFVGDLLAEWKRIVQREDQI